MLSIIRERSDKMFGYLLRHNSFMINIFKGGINGHKERGRSRKTYIEEIIRQADCRWYVDMKRLAINREE